MSNRVPHLSHERVQEWLDGQLTGAERARVQAHLERCFRCRGEVAEWQKLLTELAELPSLAPRPGFGGRVLHALGNEQRGKASLAARVWNRLARPFHAGLSTRHLDSGRLQDVLEGSAGPLSSLIARRHVRACVPCRQEARAWSAMLGRLDRLPYLTPPSGFCDAVMARVRLPEPASARQALLRRALDQGRALAGVGERRAWAAAAGMALTPAVIAGVIAYAVFSHPLATVWNLLSFLWLRGTTLAGLFGAWLTELLVQSAALFRAWLALDTLARSPAAAGAGLLACSALTLAAAWVLYRNLFAPAARLEHARR